MCVRFLVHSGAQSTRSPVKKKVYVENLLNIINKREKGIKIIIEREKEIFFFLFFFYIRNQFLRGDVVRPPSMF
jgi:hypothetical protein